MPEHNTGTMGGKINIYLSFYLNYFVIKKGTMRLGRRTTHFVTDDSIISMYLIL
jgi:hypothetical protein